MKKHVLLSTFLIIIGLNLSAQKTKDVLYLKNGSIINGKLIEIKEDKYKMKASDGSIFICNIEEVDRFAKESPAFGGRKSGGFSFALEAGILSGAQHTTYPASFSFNMLAGFIAKTKNIVSFGSGVEFLGKSYTPLFIEYKRIIFDRKTAPFVFLRGGGVVHIGGADSNSYDYSYDYTPYNYKGGGSFTLGTGISWAKDDYETYLSFAYRYAHISYQQNEYNKGIVTYVSSLNRLEMKFGFRF